MQKLQDCLLDKRRTCNIHSMTCFIHCECARKIPWISRKKNVFDCSVFVSNNSRPFRFSSFRRPGEPPVAPGHWFWGNCIQFKEHAVKFLLKAHMTCGDVFTLRLLNQHITMVLDVHSYERFAKEKNFDFHEITKQVNRNVFDYELYNSRKMIGEAGQKVNGRHLFTSMENFALNLKNAFKDMGIGAADEQTSNISDNQSQLTSEENLNVINSVTSINTSSNNNKNSHDIMSSEYKQQHQHQEIILNPSTDKNKVSSSWHEDDLRNFASRTFFSPLFYTIFGRGEKGQEKNFHPQVFHKMFDQFHKYFNFLWLGVPAHFFPEAVKAGSVLAQQPSSADMMARDGCSEYIKFATDFMLRHKYVPPNILIYNILSIIISHIL